MVREHRNDLVLIILCETRRVVYAESYIVLSDEHVLEIFEVGKYGFERGEGHATMELGRQLRGS